MQGLYNPGPMSQRPTHPTRSQFLPKLKSVLAELQKEMILPETFSFSDIEMIKDNQLQKLNVYREIDIRQKIVESGICFDNEEEVIKFLIWDIEGRGKSNSVQTPLFPIEAPLSLGVTFQDSKKMPVHSWYPYVEGFSSSYVSEVLKNKSPGNVYDPFGGSGTTQLSASLLGIPSYFSEINPFMVFVAETKTSSAFWGRQNYGLVNQAFDEFISEINSKDFRDRVNDLNLEDYFSAFPERDYFQEKDLRELLLAKNVAKRFKDYDINIYNLLLLACSSIAVESSNMTRRADLRRRREDEYINRIVDVKKSLISIIERIRLDIGTLPTHMAEVKFVSNDCRDLPVEFYDCFDFAITSPPYLNGTNYIRNTKIELWLTDYIKHEGDLAVFRNRSITAGISNVGNSSQAFEYFEEVEKYALVLDGVSRDNRIPLMVRRYFSDMKTVLEKVYQSLRREGEFLIDIGDSKFYGVHVPTDELIIYIAKQVGFECIEQKTIAKRYSRDKTELKQVEIILGKRGVL